MAENNSVRTEEPALPPLPAAPEASGLLLDNEDEQSSSWPSQPEEAFSYGEVRFLIAASTPFPLTIAIDNTIYSQNGLFGTIGNYNPVPDGFHEVSIHYSYGPRLTLFRKPLPFKAGQHFTMVVLDSETTGITISQISDIPCSSLNKNYGCYRAANMSSSGSFYDILLPGGESVFRNIAYNTVSPYKQAEEGLWTFQVSSLTCSETYREIPVIPAAAFSASCTWASPVLTLQADIIAGKSYTTYLIGNTWSGHTFRALTVEDGSSSPKILNPESPHSSL
ncbi:hypothetical protein AALB16_13720 [Lachnospiraceae bacterium 62-35]